MFVDGNEANSHRSALPVFPSHHPTHLLKLHGKKPKTFDAPTIESRRDETLLKLDLLHERSDVRKRRPQLP